MSQWDRSFAEDVESFGDQPRFWAKSIFDRKCNVESSKGKDAVLTACDICSQPVIFVALMKCGHSSKTCWLCIERIKRQKEKNATCLVCQTPLEGYIFSDEDRPWAGINTENLPRDEGSGSICRDEALFRLLKIVKEYRCWYQSCRKKVDGSCLFGESFKGEIVEVASDPFRNSSEWMTHLKDVHSRVPCDICFKANENVKFPSEWKLYSVKDLKRHRRQGGKGCRPHICCSVCSEWLYDDEAFELHWKSSDCHFACNICHKDGLCQVVFANTSTLFNHNVKTHHPCLESDCKVKGMVFRTNHELQLHMAQEHIRSSEFYESAGRKGILIKSLHYNDMDEAQSQQNTRRTRATSKNLSNVPSSSRSPQQEHFEDDDCAMWPLEMIAESDTLKRFCFCEIPSRFNSASESSAYAQERYELVAKVFFPNQAAAEEIRKETLAFQSFNNLTEALLHSCCRNSLSQIVSLIWMAFSEAEVQVTAPPDKKKAITGGGKDIDGSDGGGSAGEKPNEHLSFMRKKSQSLREQIFPVVKLWSGGNTATPPAESNLLLPSEILALIILSIPPNLDHVKKSVFQILSGIAAHAPVVRRHMPRNMASQALTLGLVPTFVALSDGEDTERNPVRKAPDFLTKGAGLLPVSKNVSFIDALQWALRYYIWKRRFTQVPNYGFNDDDFPPPGLGVRKPAKPTCPIKIGKVLLEKMRSFHTKNDLETLSQITSDLSEYISVPDLDKIQALRITYYRLREQKIQEANSNRAPTGSSCNSEWAENCDLALKPLLPAQVILLFHYVNETKGLIPTALTELPELRSGIDRSRLVLDRFIPKLQNGRAAFLNTRTYKVSSIPTNLAEENDDEFPQLGIGRKKAQPLNEPLAFQRPYRGANTTNYPAPKTTHNHNNDKRLRHPTSTQQTNLESRDEFPSLGKNPSKRLA